MKCRVYRIKFNKFVSTAKIPFRPYTDEYCEEVLRLAKENGALVQSVVVETRTREQAINNCFFSMRYAEAITYQWACKKIKK